MYHSVQSNPNFKSGPDWGGHCLRGAFGYGERDYEVKLGVFQPAAEQQQHIEQRHEKQNISTG